MGKYALHGDSAAIRAFEAANAAHPIDAELGIGQVAAGSTAVFAFDAIPPSKAKKKHRDWVEKAVNRP